MSSLHFGTIVVEPLGLGIIGLHHQHPRWYHPLWAYLPQYKPLAIAEPDEKFLKNENEFFKLDAYSDYRKLLEREDIDVVIIWLPHSQMPDAVEAAATMGKHVIVEKPCAANVEGAEKIMRVAKEHPQIKISAPYCWRNHPVSVKIKEIVREGLIGEITAMEARLNADGAYRYIRDNSQWMLKASEGGGPMWNLGVHWIDYMRWLTTSEVQHISGVINGPLGKPKRNIEDNSQAVMNFANGAIAMLDISYGITASYPGERDIYFAARGTLGSFSWTPVWNKSENYLDLVSEHPEVEKHVQRIRIISRRMEGYGGQMGYNWLSNFAENILKNTQPEITPGDILAAVKTVDRFCKSLN